MSIKETTKQTLFTYIGAVLGHTLPGECSTLKASTWSVVCKRCDTPSDHKLTTLLQLQSTNRNIACPGCKHEKKIEKFEEQNGLGYDPDTKLVHCNACTLRYRYTGDFYDNFRCFCKMKICRSTRAVFEWLTRAYPSAVLQKEVPYGTHKIDIVMELGDHRYFFEIDDSSHFTTTSPHRASDKLVMDKFLEEAQEKAFFIRIPEVAVAKDDLFDHLDDYIAKDQPPLVLLVQTARSKKYDYLALDPAITEIVALK